MENLRIMSFDLDSFTLVKSKEERSKRVIDYIKNLNIDITLLQGNNNLLYDLSTRVDGYNIVYDYYNSMFLMNPILDTIDEFSFVDCSAVITKFKDEDIAFNNIKKYKKESLWEFRNMVKEYESVEHKVLAGTLPNVNIDSFCDKYNFDNICSEHRNNHILVSKELDVRVVDGPMMYSIEVQPMVVDIAYRKVR